MKSLLPRLWRHFQDIGLSFEVLAAQWLLPLMSITLPFATLARVWELFFAEVRPVLRLLVTITYERRHVVWCVWHWQGWKLLFRVTVALFAALEPRFLELDVSDMTKFFRKWKQLCAEQHSLDHDAGMLYTPKHAADIEGLRFNGSGASASAGAAIE